MSYANKGLLKTPALLVTDGDVKMMASSIATEVPSVNRAIR